MGVALTASFISNPVPIQMSVVDNNCNQAVTRMLHPSYSLVTTVLYYPVLGEMSLLQPLIRLALLHTYI